MIAPIDDPRHFPEVLTDWLARNELSRQAAAKLLGASHGSLIVRWLDGKPVQYEPAIRAAMTLVDEGRM